MDKRKFKVGPRVYRSEPLSFWEHIIWSGESKFEVMNQRKRKRVWCRLPDRLKWYNLQVNILENLVNSRYTKKAAGSNKNQRRSPKNY